MRNEASFRFKKEKKKAVIISRDGGGSGGSNTWRWEAKRQHREI